MQKDQEERKETSLGGEKSLMLREERLINEERMTIAVVDAANRRTEQRIKSELTRSRCRSITDKARKGRK